MKHTVRKVINKLGYDLIKIRRENFTISGINYSVGECTVGETPQGEMIANGAIRMIKERELKELKILDICSGIGIIGLTIFSNLRHDSIVRDMAFADINIFNIESIFKTLSKNKLDKLPGSSVRCYLSNGLNGIPEEEKFDIIVSNPPHYFEESFSEQDVPLSPNTLGTYDPNWNFHKLFYESCHKYLADNGEVWFLENGVAAKEKDFLPFIEKNDELKYVEQIVEPLDPKFFWMITKKS